MKKIIFLGLLVFVLVFGIICCGGDDEKYNCTHCKDNGCAICGNPHDYGEKCNDQDCKDCYPNPGHVFGLTFANLEGESITVDIPGTLSNGTALKTKLGLVFVLLDTKAGTDAAFKAKINAVLGKGLKVVVKDTEEGPGIAVVNNEIHVKASYIEEEDSEDIANIISIMINNGALSKAYQLNAVRMAEELKVRKARFEEIATSRKADKILV